MNTLRILLSIIVVAVIIIAMLIAMLIATIVLLVKEIKRLRLVVDFLDSEIKRNDKEMLQ